MARLCSSGPSTTRDRSIDRSHRSIDLDSRHSTIFDPLGLWCAPAAAPGPMSHARHREQREAKLLVRTGEAVRRPLSDQQRRALFKSIDRREQPEFGIRKLCRLQLDDALPPYENTGVGWLDEVTLLEYASWHGRDHIVRALLAGGADPFPEVGGACRSALVAMPAEGACWLLRGWIRMRFDSVMSAAALGESGDPASVCRCERCGTESDRSRSAAAGFVRWPCGHRCCTNCIWTGVGGDGAARWCGSDEDALMLRCPRCHHHHTDASTLEAAHAALDELVPSAASSGADQALHFPAPAAGSTNTEAAVRSAALERGLGVQTVRGNSRDSLVVRTVNFPFRAGLVVDAGGTGAEQAAAARARRAATQNDPMQGEDWSCRVCGYPNWRRRETCRNCSASQTLAVAVVGAACRDETSVAGRAWALLEAMSEPSERKASTRARYLQLAVGDRWQRLGARWKPAEDQEEADIEPEPEPEPDAKTEEVGVGEEAKRRLVPMPPADSMLEMAMSMEITQADTDTLLLKAAGKGDLLRIRACLLHGCDLEATDECGQTALFLAAWRGRVAALQLLNWAGAELTGTHSHGGCSVTDAGRAPCRGKTAADTADCLAVLAPGRTVAATKGPGDESSATAAALRISH